MNGYLLILPENAQAKSTNNHNRTHYRGVVFLGDGLEKLEGVKSGFLKNIGQYIGSRETLEVFGEFTYAEVKYIRSKNKELRIKVNTKRSPADYQRQVKDAQEIVLIKKSMQIVEQVFGQVKQLLGRERSRPFPIEAELASFIKQAGLKLGAEDISFPPIVASSANAAVPHHVPSNKRLKAGESIILDFGFKYKNYCSDFTRTVFLKTVPKRLEMAYNQVERAYNESIHFVSSRVHPRDPLYLNGKGIPRSVALARNDTSVTGNEVYQKSVDVLKEKHLDKYFIHSLGHGTGLEIHELPNLSPKSKDILKDGMVFSIEPGVYIPKLGGIRIEDLVYLEKGKVKKFINVSTDLISNII